MLSRVSYTRLIPWSANSHYFCGLLTSRKILHPWKLIMTMCGLLYALHTRCGQPRCLLFTIDEKVQAVQNESANSVRAADKWFNSPLLDLFCLVPLALGTGVYIFTYLPCGRFPPTATKCKITKINSRGLTWLVTNISTHENDPHIVLLVATGVYAYRPPLAYFYIVSTVLLGMCKSKFMTLCCTAGFEFCSIILCTHDACPLSHLWALDSILYYINMTHHQR